jgi:hypothetical protein
MITSQQIEKFETIFKSDGESKAYDYAKSIVEGTPHSTASERGSILNSIKPDLFSNKAVRDVFMQAHSEVINCFFESQKAKKNTVKKAKKNNNASIKKTCESILACFGLSDYECQFLNDIKTKRKLTEKQIKWLTDLAKKHSIEIKGQFASKAAKAMVSNCQHEDLGSLGYRHGDTVKCPYCGQMAEVW